MFGKTFDVLILPYNQDILSKLRQKHDLWCLFFCSFMGQVDNHYPKSRLLESLKTCPIVFPKILKKDPLPGAQTVFTDGAKNGFAVVSDGTQVIRKRVADCSAQKAEVTALILALQTYSLVPLNVFTDSLYIARLASAIETAPYIGKQSTIMDQLQTVQLLIWARADPLFIGHIRSHSGLPGPLAAGNAMADAATHATNFIYTITEYDKALQLHNKFHLNAQTLRFRSGCSRDQALKIVSLCPTCAPFIHSPSLGVNPRGLQPNDI